MKTMRSPADGLASACERAEVAVTGKAVGAWARLSASAPWRFAAASTAAASKAREGFILEKRLG